MDQNIFQPRKKKRALPRDDRPATEEPISPSGLKIVFPALNSECDTIVFLLRNVHFTTLLNWWQQLGLKLGQRARRSRGRRFFTPLKSGHKSFHFPNLFFCRVSLFWQNSVRLCSRGNTYRNSVIIQSVSFSRVVRPHPRDSTGATER